jgi:O-antigen/teichoic acid export membrane protein
MMNKITSLVRLALGHGVARIMSGAAVNQISGLILSLAIPYLLCESDFGAVRVATAYMTVILMAGAFSLPVATASYIGRNELPEDKSRYGTNGLYLGFIISLLVGITAVIISWRWHFFNSQTVAMAFISRAGILFLIVLTSTNLRALQAFGQIKALARLTASVGVVKLLFVIPLTKIFGLWGWMIGMGVSDFILFVMTTLAVKPYLSFHLPRRKEIGDLVHFSAIQVFSGVMAMIAGNLDLMTLERMKVDLSSIGYYGLAVMFFKQLALPGDAFGVANFSRIGETCHNLPMLREHLVKMFIRMLAFISVIAVCMLIIVPFFIRSVYPSSYEASIPIFRLLCIGLPFLATWCLISHINIAIGKPLFEVSMSLTGLVFMISSLYILLSRLNMGLTGAAWSLNICYISGAIMGSSRLLLFLSKRKPLKIIESEVCR